MGECGFLCCVLSLSLSLSLSSRSFVKIQRILHLIVDLKTLSCKKERKSAPCEKELHRACGDGHSVKKNKKKNLNNGFLFKKTVVFELKTVFFEFF